MSLNKHLNKNKRTASPEMGKRRSKRLLSDGSCKTETTSASSTIVCVCFDLEVKVRLIPHRAEYSEDDREEIWYNRYEKQAMMEGALKCAADLTPQDEMARGLEQFTWEGGDRRSDNRERYAACILREQARQKRRKIEKGDEVLARAAAHISGPCQQEAARRGHLDEVEAIPQWHLKLPDPTADEFPNQQRLTGLLGWLKGEREWWSRQ